MRANASEPAEKRGTVPAATQPRLRLRPVIKGVVIMILTVTSRCIDWIDWSTGTYVFSNHVSATNLSRL